jgi:lipopolysaccharide transport system ATP-binding protein
MYVRLAFSVAAYLEPEILMVDEVLAVGDAEFQRKSLGKMKNVAHEGRTVLLVTHNMAMVRQICDMAIHLDQGAVQNTGDKSDVIDAYLARLVVPGGTGRGGDEALWGELSIVEPGKQAHCAHLTFGRDYDFNLRIGSKHQFRRAVVHVKLFDQEGSLVSSLESLVEGIDQFDFIGLADVVFKVKAIGLRPGLYWAGFELYVWGEDRPTLSVERALDFEIIAATVDDAFWPYLREHGIVRLASSAELRTSNR